MANTKVNWTSIGRYALSMAILGVSVGLAVTMTLSRKAPEDKENAELLQTVTVFSAQKFDGKLEIDVSGIVEPHREIEIATQVAGVVSEKSDLCRAGTWVEADTPLLSIDSTNYDLAVQRIEAEKKQAEASITELNDEIKGIESSLKLAKREHELQQNEYDRRMRAGSALSQTERDQALRALNTAERAWTDLQSGLRNANSRRVRLESGIVLSDVKLKEAKLNRERCEIKTPFSGVIVSDMVEKGDYVTSGDNVVVFEDTSMADVKCNLRFEQLQQIIKYQVPDSRFTLDPVTAYQLPPTAVTITRNIDGTVTEWSGTLQRYDGIGVDAQTKMIPCRIVVDDPVTMASGHPEALVRGMFVKVRIPLNVFESDDEMLLRFPEIAVQPGNFVWSVVDDKLKRHKVDVIDRQNFDDPDPRKRMVVARVHPGDLSVDAAIVISPLAQPNPGTEVKLAGKENESSPAETVMPAVSNRSTSSANETPVSSDKNETDEPTPSSAQKVGESTRS